MKNWIDRPFEIRNLFNPSFCALILMRAFDGFFEENKNGMPFSLSLLILPLCLHKESREILAQNNRSYLLKTFNNNPQIQVGFGPRTKNLLPYTFEGLGFALNLGAIEVIDDGSFIILEKKLKKSISGTIESIQCQKVANMLGKHFARINDRVTIYTTLGIRP